MMLAWRNARRLLGGQEVFALRLGRFAFLDVDHHGDEIFRRAGRSSYAGQRELAPDDLAVIADIPLLQRVGLDLAGGQALHLCQVVR